MGGEGAGRSPPRRGVSWLAALRTEILLSGSSLAAVKRGLCVFLYKPGHLSSMVMWLAFPFATYVANKSPFFTKQGANLENLNLLPHVSTYSATLYVWHVMGSIQFTWDPLGPVGTSWSIVCDAYK